MKITKKFISFCLILLFSFTFAQNSNYEDYEENVKDTVIINGAKYARVVDEDYFEDLEYDDGMWSLLQAMVLAYKRINLFNNPPGYSINIITPYGFDIGPLYYRISFALGSFEAEYNQFLLINWDHNWRHFPVNPFYIGIGGDLNF